MFGWSILVFVSVRVSGGCLQHIFIVQVVIIFYWIATPGALRSHKKKHKQKTPPLPAGSTLFFSPVLLVQQHAAQSNGP